MTFVMNVVSSGLIMMTILCATKKKARNNMKKDYNLSDKLWSDLTTDDERIEFLRYGRAVQTGIIAPALVGEIADLFEYRLKNESEK